MGSVVDLRGVQVGKVTEIDIPIDLGAMKPIVPVYIEIDCKAGGRYAAEGR